MSIRNMTFQSTLYIMVNRARSCHTIVTRAEFLMRYAWNAGRTICW